MLSEAEARAYFKQTACREDVRFFVQYSGAEGELREEAEALLEELEGRRSTPADVQAVARLRARWRWIREACDQAHAREMYGNVWTMEAWSRLHAEESRGAVGT